MVTVIIPTLNEQETISQVIQLVARSELVTEILVIDDKSLDNTKIMARAEKARIYTSTKLGKGASMRDGMMLAANEIIVYLDADIPTYPVDIVERMVNPLLDGSADFVKSCFDRQAGRVTELVAKPLLSFLFPELTVFSQPLSGMIAGKKSLFEKMEFENDYGVDIGLLIDMQQAGARIFEINIGFIENRMQSWEALAQMSKDVSKAILKRAELIKQTNLGLLGNISVIRDQMDFAIRESLLGMKKMLILDMDYTILDGSFIATLANRFGFRDKLLSIVTENSNPYTRTKLIARLLKGLTIKDLLDTVDSIPSAEYFEETVSTFRKEGYVCGIISDSYDFITNHIVNRFGLDFSIANELEFSKSKATGEVKVPSVFIKGIDSKCNHEFCKSNAMREVARRYGIEVKNIIAVGDSENDICMVKECGIGIAFCSSNETLNLVASRVIKERNFKPLLDILEY